MNANTMTRREQILSSISQIVDLLGVVALWDFNSFNVVAEGNNLLLILVFEGEAVGEPVSHYILDGVHIQERRLAKSILEERAAAREDRSLIQWMMQGEIWLDSEAYLERFRHDLLQYPAIVKQQKLLSEFSLFLKRYLQCKDFLYREQILDAYSSILRAIHHWARIAVLEEGVLPEATMWEQVRRYNPGVYKLYEELTASPETLRQRVELVLLACEFSVMSKMASCCSLLIRILEEARKPLSISQLLSHPYLSGNTSANLPLLLSKMARKMLVKEVVVTAHESGLFPEEVRYTVLR